MKIGIMQPYLFPYLPYFQLIRAVDKFLVYGEVQYIKKGWINRNNILLNGSPWLFSFSLQKADHRLPISQRRYADNFEKEKRHFEKVLENAYRRAPQFDKAFPLLLEILKDKESNVLAYNTRSLQLICDYLGWKNKIEVQPDIEEAGMDKVKRIEKICKLHGAEEYVNPVGGQEIYDRESFRKRGMSLYFVKTKEFRYQQFAEPFVPYLSIIDALMFNDVEEMNTLLTKFELC